MDNISSPEFHAIFHRVNVDLKGAFTVENINKRLYDAKLKCIRKRSFAKTQSERSKLKRSTIFYDRLRENGFAERTLREALKRPKGIIAMTLKHGKEEAKRRILAQRKVSIRIRRQRYTHYPQ
jgi:hypothetical protein